ncbi:MAG: hypothetical protein CMO01_12655 [Thalassobius sp.]|nr:hypothetical protein [Thalassovita sp.]
MSKTRKLIHVFILTILLINFGCNNDDDDVTQITLQDLEVTMDENPSDGQTVGTVQTAGGTALNFSIVSQDPSGAIDIDSGSGEVTVSNASLFDYEVNPTLTAIVNAENAENPVTITITLNNVSEVSAQALEVTMDENPSNGDIVGTLQTTGSASGFTITSQSPTGALDINSATGQVTVADASLFDYETNPTITATVTLEDAENPVMVTIHLENVIEISAQDFTISIDENPTDGQVLGTLQVNGSGTLEYSITSQTPSGALALNASTGEMTVIDPNLFDYETNPVITAAISVNNSSDTVTATATINLNDVDEITAEPTNFTIDENPSNGDIIGGLQVSGSNLTYTITYQNPVGAFSINENTGEISVADETLFDYETSPNMLATISVSNGTQTVSANAFVALNDVNEIGEFKYGGVIFWIDPASNNSEGLVIALTNQSSNSLWGCAGILTGATGDVIGTGETNTNTIVSAGCTTSGSAAELVSNLTLNGYDDWFLPSTDEWAEVYNNLSIIKPVILSNGGEDFLSTYWSSTENDEYNADFFLFQQPGAGVGYSYYKSNSSGTRAIRAWTDL